MPLMSSKDMLHGFVLSQIASLFGYAASSCLIISVGQK